MDSNYCFSTRSLFLLLTLLLVFVKGWQQNRNAHINTSDKDVEASFFLYLFCCLTVHAVWCSLITLYCSFFGLFASPSAVVRISDCVRGKQSLHSAKFYIGTQMGVLRARVIGRNAAKMWPLTLWPTLQGYGYTINFVFLFWRLIPHILSSFSVSTGP